MFEEMTDLIKDQVCFSDEHIEDNKLFIMVLLFRLLITVQCNSV